MNNESQNTNRTLLRLEENHKTKKVKYYIIEVIGVDKDRYGNVFGVYKKIFGFVESEDVAKAICKDGEYSYEEIEKEIEVEDNA